MAKVMLHAVLAEMHVQHPQAQIRQYIDDLAQRISGDKAKLMLSAPPAAAALAARLRKEGLVISSKTSVVSTCPAAAARTLEAIQRGGAKASIAKFARDLGIDNSAGATRRLATHNERFF